MSTPPIRLAIGAADETGPAFSSATAAAQTFQAKVQASTGSFTEARGAAKLFSEEIGVGMNRELLRAVASSQLLQGALSAALPVGLAIGFAEFAMRIPEAIKKATDALAGYDEASKKAMEDAITANDAALTQFKTLEDGYKRLGELRKLASGAATAKDSFSDPLFGVGQAFSSGGASGALAQLTANFSLAKQFREESAHWSDDETKAIARQGELQVEKNKEAQEAATKAHQQFMAELHEINKEADEFWKSWRKLNEELDKSLEKLKDSAWTDNNKRVSGQRAALAPWMNVQVAPPPGAPMLSDQVELLKIQQDQNEAWKKAAEIVDQVETPLQKYNDTLAILNTLLHQVDATTGQTRISQQQYNAAVAQAQSAMNKADGVDKYWKTLGQDIGKTVEQAMLFQESWSKAFRTLLADIIKLVLELYVFKSLATQFGGANGGFFGALFTGLAGGRASGGPVSGGMSYLVGESGPEIFTPGASGAITPNSGLGGGGPVQVFDMRGSVVSGDVVRRAEMVGSQKASENRAVARAIAVYTDLQARR